MLFLFSNPLLVISIILLLIIGIFLLGFFLFRQHHLIESLMTRQGDLHQLTLNLYDTRQTDQNHLVSLKEQLWRELQDYRQGLSQQQLQGFALLQNSLQQGMQGMSERIDQLIHTTQSQLQTISSYMEQRLSEGLSKTTKTFSQVMERLALIDAAQAQMRELSGQVVNLQHILVDKRARGVFGEMQLQDLIQNVLPADCFKLQYTFSNGKRADCVLFLPPPIGILAIDAKFPLESFRRIIDTSLTEAEKRLAQAQFRQDVRYHIQSVANKYILPGETTEGAILFIPAETIFAEIHANHLAVVEEAQKLRVWLTSPATLMAVLTTAKAVLRDVRMREQLHVVQKHLVMLKSDFERFQLRMNKLAQHIQQAHMDIQEARTSAEKITHRFERIEKVELDKK
jgi:DNA recombination protein RmuC